MLMIFTWACLLFTYAMLALMLVRLRKQRRQWLELQAEYQLLLQNHEAFQAFKYMMDEAAQQALQSGEKSCLIMEIEPTPSPDTPPGRSPTSRRLH